MLAVKPGKMLGLSKAAGFDQSGGLLNALHRLESSLQFDLASPGTHSNIAEFIAELNFRRHAWFDKYKTFRHWAPAGNLTIGTLVNDILISTTLISSI